MKAWYRAKYVAQTFMPDCGSQPIVPPTPTHGPSCSRCITRSQVAMGIISDVVKATIEPRARSSPIRQSSGVSICLGAGTTCRSRKQSRAKNFPRDRTSPGGNTLLTRITSTSFAPSCDARESRRRSTRAGDVVTPTTTEIAGQEGCAFTPWALIAR